MSKYQTQQKKSFLHSWLYIFLLLGMLSLLTACPSDGQNTEGKDKQVLRIGFIPSENMTEIQKNVQPLVELMSDKMGVEVQPFIATDYTGVVEAFRSGKLDAAFLSPASYVMANSEAGVQVVLKAQRGDKPFYYSIVFARKDSQIKSIQDFKGKTFAFGDNLSTAGYIYPLKMFNEAGINPSTDFDNLIFSGGHDATVLAVYNKKVVGGATYANDKEGKEAAWVHLLKPEEQAQMQVVAISDPIPSDNICVSKDLEPKLAEKVKSFFLDLSHDPTGQALVKKLYRIDRFVVATNDDYKGIREAFSLSGIAIKENKAQSKVESNVAKGKE